MWVHAGNSSTVDNQGDEGNLAWLRGLAAMVGAWPMVRAGIALYGYCLPIEGEGLSEGAGRAAAGDDVEDAGDWAA